MIMLLLACGVHLPEPTLVGMTPDRGWNGEQTVVTIQGDGFYPQVEIDTSNQGGVDLDRGYRAWLTADDLGRHSLSAVAVDNYQQLRAVVRSGIAAGQYDLVVEGPTGRSAVLEDAFIVSDTRADQLIIEGVQPIATVNDQVFVTLKVVDPDREPLVMDLEVELSVTGEGPLLGGFGGGLDDAEPLDDVIGVRGRLGSDGIAVVPLTIETPGTVTIEVHATDPSLGVRGDQVPQLWQPGDELVSVFELPAPSFEVEAGEGFMVDVHLEDQFGNKVTNVTENLLVRTSCGDFIDAWSFTGSGSFEVVPTRSTQFGNCAEQRLMVLEGPRGESAAFGVRAGLPESFMVSPVFPSVRAGEDVIVLVSARDPYDNRTVFPTQLTITDSVGGVGDWVCEPGLNGIDRNCRVTSFVAGDAVTMRVASGAVMGDSPPYQVLASLDITRLTVIPPAVAVAGEESVVLVRLFDPWDNLIDADELDLSGLVTQTGDGARAPCSLLGAGATGELELRCDFERARDGETLTVVLDTLSATSTTFRIINGELDNVTLDTPETVMAGQAFDIGLAAFDAFGNPYTEQASGGVSLRQLGFPTVPVTLEPDGTAIVPWSIDISGSWAIEALDDLDQLLGVSDQILVLPGDPATIDVTPARPWVVQGEAMMVELQVRDAFGNPSPSTQTVSLTTTSGLGTGSPVGLVGGAGTGTIVWSLASLDDRIHAATNTISGVSVRVDALGDCVDGPTAVADFGGAPTGRACVEPGNATPVALSMVDSQQGATPIAFYGAIIDGRAVRSLSPAFNVEVDQVGRSAVELVVADTAGCAAFAATEIWAGPDDGQPVGELDIVVSADEVVLGQPVAVTVTGAVDCTGDLSTGGLRIRTDRGTISGGRPTGTGLELQLDATGSSAALLETDVETGGTATLAFDSPSGGASAQRTVELLGDDRSPRVWAQQPLGFTDAQVSTIVLEVDEPLLASTVDPSAFELTSDSGPVAITSTTLTSPRTVTLQLAAPIDGQVEIAELRATTELRDVAGNRLDGTESGAPADWVGAFGMLPSTLDPVVCSSALDGFRPDGDSGAGIESDILPIAVSSDSVPTWWRLRIDDEEGERRFQEHRVPAGTSDLVEWDGRDATGRIVPDGVYTVRLAAEDAVGNRSAPCVFTVQVDNARAIQP